MKVLFLRKFLLMQIFLCMFGSRSFAIVQDSAATEKHAFNEDRWKAITKDIDYSKEAAQKVTKMPGQFHFPINAGVAKIILFILVLSLLIFLLVRVFVGNLSSRNKKIKEDLISSELQPEENIHQADLEKACSAAIAEENFRLAIRLYYLMSIRELSVHQLIHWKREKTNREYLHEMMNHVAIRQFRDITWLFERIWYGEAELNDKNFQSIHPRFTSFIEEIKNQKAGTLSIPLSGS